MNIEEKYGFDIPDHEVLDLRSVGELHAYILSKAEPRPDAEESWNWLRDMIESEFLVPRERITPEAWVVRDLGIN